MKKTVAETDGSQGPKPKGDPTVAAALFRDALEAARNLKRKHRTYYATDHKGFRTIVRKAHSRIFRLKPGPKADARITRAARERAAGGRWPDLYAKHIDNYATMSEYTKDLAEAGLQRKVNAYLQHHRHLRLKSSKKTVASKSRQ